MFRALLKRFEELLAMNVRGPIVFTSLLTRLRNLELWQQRRIKTTRLKACELTLHSFIRQILFYDHAVDWSLLKVSPRSWEYTILTASIHCWEIPNIYKKMNVSGCSKVFSIYAYWYYIVPFRTNPTILKLILHFSFIFLRSFRVSEWTVEWN